MRYYPNPKGGRGAILYIGGIDVNTGGGVWNGKWFNATPEGDAGIARLIKYVTSSSAAANAAQPDSAPAASADTKSSAPSNSPATPAKDATSDIPYMLTLLASGIVLFSVVGALGCWLGRRRSAC